MVVTIVNEATKFRNISSLSKDVISSRKVKKKISRKISSSKVIPDGYEKLIGNNYKKLNACLASIRKSGVQINGESNETYYQLSKKGTKPSAILKQLVGVLPKGSMSKFDNDEAEYIINKKNNINLIAYYKNDGEDDCLVLEIRQGDKALSPSSKKSSSEDD